MENQQDFKKYIDSKEKLACFVQLNTKLIVVIPCYNETTLSNTLRSLNNATEFSVFEVVVVINYGIEVDEKTKLFNINVHQQLLQEIDNQCYLFKIHALLVKDLPHKIAGVGMARKIGMDYASMLFGEASVDGILACLDADCEVESNYVTAIIEYFQHHSVEAASIHFEHPLPADEIQRKYIVDYELHLRYHINFQKYLQLPFAYQTIGSSMAVRVNAYLKEGGMNKRKAGEDFYFLHKYTIKGTLGEIKTTTVLPSARISDRVPFGTGKAMQDRYDGLDAGTYHYNSYNALKPLVQQLHQLYPSTSTINSIQLIPCIREYLEQQKVNDMLNEIRNNTTSLDAFIKRFYQWFNAFRLMKYLHFARDNYYPNIPVEEAAQYLGACLEIKTETNTAESLLMVFRLYDKRK